MQYGCLFIWLFDNKALLVCIKDRTCLRMAIPAYHFNIFGSIFGALFCSLFKRLILGFISEVWVHSPDGQKRNISFLHIGMIWIFQVITFSLDLKISKLEPFWKFGRTPFWEKSYQLLMRPNDIWVISWTIWVYNTT